MFLFSLLSDELNLDSVWETIGLHTLVLEF